VETKRRREYVCYSTTNFAVSINPNNPTNRGSDHYQRHGGEIKVEIKKVTGSLLFNYQLNKLIIEYN
jgi:hypothetical protein